MGDEIKVSSAGGKGYLYFAEISVKLLAFLVILIWLGVISLCLTGSCMHSRNTGSCRLKQITHMFILWHETLPGAVQKPLHVKKKCINYMTVKQWQWHHFHICFFAFTIKQIRHFAINIHAKKAFIWHLKLRFISLKFTVASSFSVIH